MGLRNRGGIWHYRFKVDGREYAGTTDLAATRPNASRALAIELEHRQALLEGRRPMRKIIVRGFSDAADEFLDWAKLEYRAHPNSYKRIKTSFTSLKDFFSQTPVSLVDEAKIENYKSWRLKEHEIRDITLRHDLHALSVFFGYAIKQNWTRDNPVRGVEIPSDADAVRIHVITPEEEEEYFRRAAKNQNLTDLARLMRLQLMRPEEVVSLAKTDVDLERGELHIRSGKTRAARRTLDLTAESKEILKRRMQGTSRWIFPSKRLAGGHIQRLNGAHDTACASTKTRPALNFVPYDFRHTAATEMAHAGVDLATLAAILGHSSLRVVQRYLHPTSEHKKNAVGKYETSLAETAKKRAAAAAAR